MRVLCASSWPEGQMQCSKQSPGHTPNHLDETLRAQRVVEHMRRRDYPTPAALPSPTGSKPNKPRTRPTPRTPTDRTDDQPSQMRIP
jgi:hypothetical protein